MSILLIALGTVGLGMSFGVTLASVTVFGVLLIVGGAFQLINAFMFKGWKSIMWHVLIALLYLVAGNLILIDPMLASMSLTMGLAYILIAVGAFRIIMAFQFRPAQGWFWLLLSGLISILLGGMIIAQWPASGLWVIGLFVSVEFIFAGWSTMFIALAARKAAQAG